MRRLPSWWLVTSLALATACGKADDKAIVTVIYNTPKDTAAFEKYYRETHLPLVSANQQEIGFTKAELTRFDSNLDGSAPATPGVKKVAGDLPNFATGGLDDLIAVGTK